jgi:hypothetical protein
MAGERRVLTPQERLLQGRAEKRKAAEAPAPSSKRPAPAPKTTVGASNAAPSAPRGAAPAVGGSRGTQSSAPRESHGGVSGQVVAPPSSGGGSRRGGSPSLPPHAISSSQLYELGRKCQTSEMPAIENFHAGLSYLGKVSVVSSDCYHCCTHFSSLFFFMSVVFSHVGPSLPLPQHGLRAVLHEAGGGV